MIERVVGAVVASDEKSITVMTGGMGFGLQVADPARFSMGKQLTVFTYMHWNQDKGPVLYGFESELARSVFCLIITCPKVGPAIGLALLRQLEPARILQDISTNNVVGLSSCQGIGPKKAQQIINELKEKIGPLLAASPALANSGAAHWQHVQDALAGLSYSRQEVADAIAYLTAEYAGKDTPEVNVLLRKALAYLSAPRS